MENTEMMKLNLTRHEVCQISLALTSLLCEMREELNGGNITDDRKKVLTSTIDMWEVLRGKVKNQIEM